MDKKKFLKAFSSFLDTFGNSSETKEKALDNVEVIKAVDEELMQAIEVVYQPYSVDVHGDWMSPETIRKACINFNENLVKGNLKPNLFHLQETDKFTIEKSWIVEVDSIIGETLVPEGTWLVKVQYNDPSLWIQKKNGDIQGVSIGAKGVRHDPVETGEEIEIAVDKSKDSINDTQTPQKPKSKVKVLPKDTSPKNDDSEQPMVPPHPELATA